MGEELLFLVSVLIWLGIFFYLLMLHLRQRKILRTIERLRASFTGVDEKREP
jgi:CcmD family protein